MIVYLLRHAIAVSRGTGNYPNDDRPLTDAGRKKMAAAAQGMRNILGRIDVIYSSPLSRAFETASMAAAALRQNSKVAAQPFLLPDVEPEKVVQHLGALKNGTALLLVGHEPQLSGIASVLLRCDRRSIEMKKGSLCCIEIDSPPKGKQGTLLWHLRPKHLRMLAR
jgi:phosphohistidine phosphatase